MKTLVTGGAGYVGNLLCCGEQLAAVGDVGQQRVDSDPKIGW